MDDFNNFFDEDKQHKREYTPIYRTPNSEPPKTKNKSNIAAIIAIVIAFIMCILVVVNVIVLATLKDSIAADYAAKMASIAQYQYSDAINQSLADKNIIDDVVDAATEGALDKLASSVSEIVGKYAFQSAAVINCFDSTKKISGTATGFLISDSSLKAPTRYLVTNAHVVQYEKQITSNPAKYGFALYEDITCKFEGNSAIYKLRVVAVGAHKGENITSTLLQPDLAICEIIGMQPSNGSHPSLTIAGSDYSKVGEDVALIGNPAGYGLSITSGSISNASKPYTGWGVGNFIMTDAAVNPGNSGGPMLNKNCVVVGVVESKIVDAKIEGMGFAVSAKTLVDFLEWAAKAPNNIYKKDISIPYKTVNIR